MFNRVIDERMEKPHTVVIKKVGGGFAAIALGLWLLFWAAIMGTMLYGILFDNDGRTDDYLTILIPITIAGILALRMFFWNLRGRDEIEFLSKTIRLTRKGSFFHRPVTVLKYDEFLGFDLGNFKPNPFWIAFWGLGGNRIIANCGNYKRLIGQGLNSMQAAGYVELLNEKVRTQR